MLAGLKLMGDKYNTREQRNTKSENFSIGFSLVLFLFSSLTWPRTIPPKLFKIRPITGLKISLPLLLSINSDQKHGTAKTINVPLISEPNSKKEQDKFQLLGTATPECSFSIPFSGNDTDLSCRYEDLCICTTQSRLFVYLSKEKRNRMKTGQDENGYLFSLLVCMQRVHDFVCWILFKSCSQNLLHSNRHSPMSPTSRHCPFSSLTLFWTRFGKYPKSLLKEKETFAENFFIFFFSPKAYTHWLSATDLAGCCTWRSILLD